MTRPTTYQTFHAQLDEVFRSNGKLCLPNVQEITDPQEALNAISRATKVAESLPYRFRVQNFDPPIEFYPGNFQTHEIAYYPKIWLNTAGMGSSFDGSGVILAWPSSNTHSRAKAYSFFMCDHEWDESGANHSRGWHPKRCTKCGFDASIDSGD